MSQGTEFVQAVQVPFAEFSEGMGVMAPWWPATPLDVQRLLWAEHVLSAMPLDEFADGLDQFPSGQAFLDACLDGDDRTSESIALLVKLDAQFPVAQAETPSPASAVVETAQQTAEDEAARIEAARREADKTCKAAVREFRKGEASYRDGLLKAGELSDSYVAQRMRLKDARSAAVTTLAGEFARYASSAVTSASVNTLIGTYHASRLLSVGMDKVPEIPYGHYREAYSQLVDRYQLDDKSEEWRLLPGYEEHCRLLFADCCQNALSRDGVLNRVKGLLSEYAAFRKGETERAKAAAEAQAKAADAVADAAKLATIRQHEAVANAESAVATATDAETKAKLTAVAEAERTALLEKQKAEREATAKAEQQARDKAKAEREAAEAAKAKERADKAAEKAAQKAAGKTDPKPATVATEPRASNPQAQLLLSAKEATAKDWAETCWTLLAEHAEPEDALEALVLLARNSGKLSTTGKKACDAFLIRSASPTNGHTVQPATVAVA